MACTKDPASAGMAHAWTFYGDMRMKSRGAKAFSEELVQPIPQRYEGEELMAQFNNRYICATRAEARDKLPALLAHYEIPLDGDEWRQLAFALAQEFVPGFQLAKAKGPKTKWKLQIKAALVRQVEALIASGQANDIETAAKRIAAAEPWKSFLCRGWGDGISIAGPGPVEALKRAYFSAKKLKNMDAQIRGQQDLIAHHGEEHVANALRNWMKDASA